MRRSVSFQQSLFFNLTIGAVILGLVLLATSLFASGRVLKAMAAELTGRAISEMNTALSGYFGPVEQIIELCLQLARTDVFADREPAELDALMAPLLDSVSQISAVHVAEANGDEYMLMRRDEGYYSRISAPTASPGRILMRTWTLAGASSPEERWSESDYDARVRPWFQGAIRQLLQVGSRSEAIHDLIHWTNPYVFFTTREPGITASVAFRSRAGEVAILAFDILLRDVSRFASDIQLRSSGKILVLLRDRQQDDLVMLTVPPMDPSAEEGDGERDPYAPRPLAEFSGPPQDYIDTLIAHEWATPELPVAFESGGDAWWGAAARTRISTREELWVAAVLPEDELLQGLPNINRLVIIALVATVIFTVFRAIRLARKYSMPITEMVSQSERMGRLNFARETVIESPIKEIQMLAASQESMRQSLQGLRAMTERREIARELRAFRLGETEQTVPGWEISLVDQIMPTVGGNVPYLVSLKRDTRGGWMHCREGEPEGLALVLVTTQLHGLRAAQEAESLRSAVRTLLRAGRVEAEALAALVREETLVHGRAVGRIALCCGVLDSAAGVLRLARWGPCPVLHRVAQDGAMLWLDGDDRESAAPPDERIFTQTLSLAPGDVVVLLSESVLDTLGSERQRFGRERLQALLEQAQDQDAPTLAEEIEESLLTFTDATPATSDRTLFVMRRCPRS